jgi:hypothetical protein
VELYFHSPVRLHGVVLIKKAQGQLYLYFIMECSDVEKENKF